MDLIEGIRTRRSIRAFQPKPVPRDIIETILTAAGRSPSCLNTQPWEVHVVTGKRRDELSQILTRLAEADAEPNPDIPTPKQWPSRLEQRFREHSARRFKAMGIERGNEQQRKELRLRNLIFYGAPCALFIFMDRSLGELSIFDLGAFCQTLALAANSFGLGTCLQGATVGYPDAVRNLLGLPPQKRLIIGISLGYPDFADRLNSYHSTRIDLSEFVSWHT